MARFFGSPCDKHLFKMSLHNSATLYVKITHPLLSHSDLS
jgi:hypothetical protein